MGEVTAIDVAGAVANGNGAGVDELMRRWVGDAWAAWAVHRDAVLTRTTELVATIG
jgi:hypothetical protein